ncbi:MAG: aspartyl protease family protein [Bacteroidota bacterium]|nr:aspartyl protease family protein [Bacteroidota bacterium]
MNKILAIAIFSLVLLHTTVIVSGQEEFVEPPAQFLTRVHFTQLTGGVILLKAILGKYPDTLNFILDTGSGGISLDSLTVQYLKLSVTPSDKTIRGIAGIRKVSFVMNQQLKLPRLTIDSLNFHINDYAILTSVYGEQIDGIIGYSVLSRYILFVNYDSSHIDFYSKGRIKYPRGGYLLKPFIFTLPIQNVRIRDEHAIHSRFLYDMGAGLCLMLSSDFVKDSTLLKKKRKKFVKEAEGLGGKIDMEMTVVTEVKLGPYKFHNVPTYIFNDDYNVTSYPYLGGILGNDLLRRFNVILNYDKRDFYITPNQHYNEPFDYSYSGIELYYINGLIVIGDVAKGSSAEAVGIKEGDIVISVNKNFSQNLQQYKITLQNSGQKAKLIIRRHEELFEFEIKIKSIL